MPSCIRQTYKITAEYGEIIICTKRNENNRANNSSMEIEQIAHNMSIYVLLANAERNEQTLPEPIV
jgi:hypothetical protein